MNYINHTANTTFSTQTVIAALDADNTFTPSTVRKKLEDTDFVDACKDFHESSNGGFFIWTASAREGLDEMMHGHQFPANVSQGTMTRFNHGGTFEYHPDLPGNIHELNEAVYSYAMEELEKLPAQFAITYNGADMHTRTAIFKPENKETCGCIVFNEKSVSDKLIAINIVQTALSKIGSDAAIFGEPKVGRDAIEWVPQGFGKLKGLEWIMSDDRFAGRKLIIAEDSNADVLQHAAAKWGSHNIGVGFTENGGKLPYASKDGFVHATCLDIKEFRQSFTSAVQASNKTGSIDLDKLNPDVASLERVRDRLKSRGLMAQ